MIILGRIKVLHFSVADLVMGPVVAFAVFISLLYLAPSYESARYKLRRQPRHSLAFKALALVWAATLLSVILGWFPVYTRQTPKRLLVQHTLREVYLSNGSRARMDSGISIEDMDYPNAPRGAFPSQTDLKELPGEWCDSMLNCGIGLERPRLSAIKKERWLDFESPNISGERLGKQ